MSLFTWYHSTANRPLLTAHNLYNQRVSKRCRPSWLIKSALVYEPKLGEGGRGGGEVAGPLPMSTAVHMEPKNLWRSKSIFNQCADFFPALINSC
jgi:hypothetical protein